MPRIAACSIDDVPKGEALKVNVASGAIALFRIADRFYAIDDRCSHGNASMSEGYVDEDDVSVECPLHAARFCLKGGAPLCQPATEPLAVYPVSVLNDTVYVDLPEAE